MKMRIFLSIAALLFVMVFYNADASNGSFTDNGDGTVSDNDIGLMWQKEDDNTKRVWNDAITYCDNLTLAGNTDWRLPSKKELISIVNYGKFNPSINTTYFPNTDSSPYWSSTIYADDTSYAWSVHFYGGGVYGYGKSGDGYVRCVRSGKRRR